MVFNSFEILQMKHMIGVKISSIIKEKLEEKNAENIEELEKLLNENKELYSKLEKWFHETIKKEVESGQ